jgi:glycosyltransferase involved in cell wall biosynthesis
MRKLTAVIITFNEARNIKRCIASLQGVADEIVVVDSFSTDATPNICKGLGVQFHQREWKGYSKQKNFGNGLASNDWILSVDADEALSEDLKTSIINEKENGSRVNFSFNRLTNYCGKWIRHSGWYPDAKVRMFDRTQDDWKGEVHEKLTVDSTKVKKLKGDLLHYSYHSVSDHVKRTDKYSTLGAQELFESGKRASIFKLIFNPWLKFNRMYFLRLGFLDGMAGFTIALITAYGTFLKYIKLYYLVKNKA